MNFKERKIIRTLVYRKLEFNSCNLRLLGMSEKESIDKLIYFKAIALKNKIKSTVNEYGYPTYSHLKSIALKFGINNPNYILQLMDCDVDTDIFPYSDEFMDAYGEEEICHYIGLLPTRTVIKILDESQPEIEWMSYIETLKEGLKDCSTIGELEQKLYWYSPGSDPFEMRGHVDSGTYGAYDETGCNICFNFTTYLIKYESEASSKDEVKMNTKIWNVRV